MTIRPPGTVSLLLALLLLFEAGAVIAAQVQPRDEAIITSADNRARAILEQIAAELSRAGERLPLNKPGFSAVKGRIGEAALPILGSSGRTFIELRIGKTGQTELVSHFTPSYFDLDIEVADASSLMIGDTVYLSAPESDDVLQGSVDVVIGNTVRIDADYRALSGVEFDTGTSLTAATLLAYRSDRERRVILRADESGQSIAATNATFSLEYLDGAGRMLEPPLTTAQLGTELSAVSITVTVRSKKKLSDGAFYMAHVATTVALPERTFEPQPDFSLIVQDETAPREVAGPAQADPAQADPAQADSAQAEPTPSESIESDVAKSAVAEPAIAAPEITVPSVAAEEIAPPGDDAPAAEPLDQAAPAATDVPLPAPSPSQPALD